MATKIDYVIESLQNQDADFCVDVFFFGGGVFEGKDECGVVGLRTVSFSRSRTRLIQNYRPCAQLPLDRAACAAPVNSTIRAAAGQPVGTTRRYLKEPMNGR